MVWRVGEDRGLNPDQEAPVKDPERRGAIVVRLSSQEIQGRQARPWVR